RARNGSTELFPDRHSASGAKFDLRHRQRQFPGQQKGDLLGGSPRQFHPFPRKRTISQMKRFDDQLSLHVGTGIGEPDPDRHPFSFHHSAKPRINFHSDLPRRPLRHSRKTQKESEQHQKSLPKTRPCPLGQNLLLPVTTFDFFHPPATVASTQGYFRRKNCTAKLSNSFSDRFHPFPYNKRIRYRIASVCRSE